MESDFTTLPVSDLSLLCSCVARMLLREVAYLIDSLNCLKSCGDKKYEKQRHWYGVYKIATEVEFSCANEKLSLLDGQQKVCELTKTSSWPAPRNYPGFISIDQ